MEEILELNGQMIDMETARKFGLLRHEPPTLEKCIIEWHDLRNNPSDVPNNKRYVWCCTWDGYDKGFYDKDLSYSKWVIGRSSFYSNIIAWCELPTFER